MKRERGRPKKEPKEFKTCKKCRKRKHSTEYYASSSQCKPCHSKTVKRNQKRNKDHYNKYRQEYALKHPEKVASWQKQTIANWEQKHGKKYKEYVLDLYRQRMSDPLYRNRVRRSAKRNREQNKEKEAERRKQYYLKNREAIRKRDQEWYKQNREHCIVRDRIYRTKKYINRAMEKNDLTKIASLMEKLNVLYEQQAIIKTQQKSI